MGSLTEETGAPCPDENELASYADRALSPPRLAQLEDHIDRCVLCRRIVSSLLRDFASTPVPLERAHVDCPSTPVAVGTSIGRYRISEVLGAGAMGIVYAAVDPDLERTVALKLIRQPAGSNRQGRRHLLLEGRAMGRLSHPNVVSVYDVGTFDHHVFITMELVRGQTLRSWVATRSPAATERWSALIEAGRGLGAAHDCELVHRDFKPDNVLVGDDGRICVTDFGLALGGDATDSGLPEPDGDPRASGWPDPDAGMGSIVTTGGLLVGTPRYMAPEQRAGDPCDAKSDQYSFCLVARELLGEDFAARSIRGAAIERGLAESPQDRWPSMHALLDVLEFGPARARRNRRLALVTIALGVASAGAWAAWSRHRSDRCTGADEAWAGTWSSSQRDELDAALRRAAPGFGAEVSPRVAARLDAYGEAWRALHVEACETSTIRGERSRASMDLQMRCLDRAKVEVNAAVEVLLHADTRAVARALELVDGLPSLDRCRDLDALAADVEPPAPHEQDAVSSIRRGLADARARERVGDIAGAKALLDPQGERLAEVTYPPVHAEVALRDGILIYRLGKHEQAVTRLEEALGLAARARLWDVVGDAARALMIVLGVEMRRFDDGLLHRPLAEALVRGDPERGVQQHLVTGAIFLGKGMQAEATEQSRRALAVAEQAFPPGHRLVLNARHIVAQTLHAAGQYPEAEAQLRRAIEAGTPALGANHPELAGLHASLGAVLGVQGKAELAEVQFRRTLAIHEHAYGSEHPLVAQGHTNLAASLAGQGKHEEAIEVARQALEECEQVFGSDHPMTVTAQVNLVGYLVKLDRLEDATGLAVDALEASERALGPTHRQTSIARTAAADISAKRGELEEARAHIARAVRDLDASIGEDHPSTSSARVLWARVLLDAGRPAEALPVAEQAWASLQRNPGTPEHEASTAATLARALWSADEAPEPRARALTLARRAIARYEQAGHHDEEIAELEAWIRERAR